jgi:threonine aldolase
MSGRATKEQTVIDLRSDTVTHPTAAMRAAMASAEVGDDVFGEDPTVNRLEAMAAEVLGKESALLLLSGTMGNLVGVLAQTRRGDEILCGPNSHLLNYEAGGASVLGGVALRAIDWQRGAFNPIDIDHAVRDAGNVHFARTRLLALENTVNREGGAAVSVADTDAACAAAHARGLRVHVDGARIFNAAVALGVPVARLVQHIDTVTFCLSKGLGCPVGSILAGEREYIEEARRWRKMVGGGLRQSGVIAAAGIVALETMVDRMADDHANAKALARGLADLPGLNVDVSRVQTNIVMVTVDGSHTSPSDFVTGMAAAGVKVGSPYGDTLRMVTHYQFDRAEVPVVLRAAERALGLIAA